MSNLKLTMIVDAKTGKVKTALGGVVTDLGKVGGAADKATAKTRNFNAQTRKGIVSISTQLSRAKKEFLAFISVSAAIKGLGNLIGMADGWNSVAAQLKVATTSQEDFGFAQSEVYRIAQQTGTQLDSTGQLYARLATSIGEMGGEIGEASAVTEALNASLKISKATTAESISVQMQFAQAVSRGKFEGEELNTLIASAPALMQAMAKQLGVNTGELKEMNAAGQLTSDVFLPAIISAQRELSDTAQGMGDTISASWQKVVNATQRWVGQKDEAIGASDAISSAFSGLAENLDHVITVTARLVLGLTAVLVARKLGPILNTVALNAKSTAAGFNLVAASSLRMKVGFIAGTAWANKTKIALNGVKMAGRGLKTVMGLLGGPAGIVLLAGSAIASFALSSREATPDTEQLASEVDGLIDSFDSLSKAQLTQAIIKLEDALPGMGDKVSALGLEVRNLADDMADGGANVSRDYERALADLGVESEKLANRHKLLGDMNAQLEGLTKKNSEATAKSSEATTALTEAEEKRIAALKGEAFPEMAKEAEFLEKKAILQKAAALGDEGATDALKKLTDEYKKGGEEGKNLNKTIENQAKEFESLYDSVDEVGAITRQYEDDKKKLRKGFEKSTIAVEDQDKAFAELERRYTENINKASGVTEQQKDMERATKEQTEAYRNLLRELNPVQAASDDYATKLAILENQFTGAARESEEFEQKVRELDAAHFGFGETLKETGDKAEETPSKVATAWEEGMKRVDNSFAQAFRNGFKDMKSFTSNIKNAFKDMLAEIAYQWAKKGIGQLFASLGSGGGMFSGIASSLSGALGGGGGDSTGGAGLLGGFNPITGTLLAAGGAAYALDKNVNIESAIGGLLLGLPGAVAGAIFGGKGDKRKSASSLDFNYSDGELTGQSGQGYKQQSGFSKKYWTEYTDLDSEIQGYVQTGMDGWSDVARTLGDAFNPDGISDRVGGWFGRAKKTIVRDIDDIVDEFVASGQIQTEGLDGPAIQEKIDEWINENGVKLMTAVLPQFETAITAAGDRASELVQPLLAVANYMGGVWEPQIRQSFQEINSSTARTALEIIAEHDGTVESTQRIAQAVTERGQIETQLLQTIYQVQGNIDQMSGNLRERIQRAQETEQQYLDRLAGETQSAIAQLSMAEDASEVNALMSTITSNMGTAMGMASEEQKAAVAQQMEGILDTADAAATTRLEQIRGEVEASHNQVADAALAAIETGDGAAAQLAIAAEDSLIAMQLMAEAALANSEMIGGLGAFATDMSAVSGELGEAGGLLANAANEIGESVAGGIGGVIDIVQSQSTASVEINAAQTGAANAASQAARDQSQAATNTNTAAISLNNAAGAIITAANGLIGGAGAGVTNNNYYNYAAA